MKYQILLFSFLCGSLLVSCTKEKDYLYEVNDVQVQQGGSGKNTPKNTLSLSPSHMLISLIHRSRNRRSCSSVRFILLSATRN
jgi:hypothetical protein